MRFVPRFIADDELPAYFRRADLVVLPYREIDQSGVLFTALAFGKPLLLSDVGGFPEMAATGAARTFPAGDAARCAARCASCSATRAARSAMAGARRGRGRRVLLGGGRAAHAGAVRGAARAGGAADEDRRWRSSSGCRCALIVWTQLGYAAALALLARVRRLPRGGAAAPSVRVRRRRLARRSCR